jgi:hypothetical protein
MPEEESARVPISDVWGERNMRKGFFAALIGLLTSAAVAPAESRCVVQEPVPPIVGPEEVLWSAPPLPCSEQCPACHERVWFNADYLLWWVHRGQVNTPLVTTSSPLAPVPGALGERSTRVLFGDDETVNFGTFSGVRIGGGFAVAEGWASRRLQGRIPEPPIASPVAIAAHARWRRSIHRLPTRRAGARIRRRLSGRPGSGRSPRHRD